MSVLCRLGGFFKRLSPSREDLTARTEAADACRRGTIHLDQIEPRSRVRVSGVLQAVTHRPASAKPVLVARLYDGTGAVDLIWLGRRDIAGVVPGAHLITEGMVTAGRSRPIIYNPAYELLGPGQ
ncbi:OB-fold nucleic acid binding domain-containing protein [Actinomyces trachealis]|uniref:OB-fold nucleic acid binding domain-containing protein n=1 Tax=Actinomyces trachealis TaxID=2763540 RepID=UPI001892A3D6|nr:OB-fold nucleic acid binding domain-containing protein [Actinomyces trachealis]